MLDLNAKLIVDAASWAEIETFSHQHRLHEQTCGEGVGLFECKALDSLLEPDSFNVTSLLSQSAIHDTLEIEAHRALKSCGVRVEECKIVVKMFVFEGESDPVAQVDVEQRENARKERHRATFALFECLLVIRSGEIRMALCLCDWVAGGEVDSKHLDEQKNRFVKVCRTIFERLAEYEILELSCLVFLEANEVV